MDMLSFTALHMSCKRVDAGQKFEAAITAYYAAQADGKTIKELLDQWRPFLEQSGNDAEAFLSKFGSGV